VRHIEKVGSKSTLTGLLKYNVRQFMTKYYTHLTQEERYHIHVYKKAVFSNIVIINKFRLHVSPIKRELARNTVSGFIGPQQAHSLAKNRHALKPKAIKETKT